VAEEQASFGFAQWKAAACEPLTGDASARKYFRLRTEGQTAILMDASRVPDSVAPFIHIARHLRQIGFSSPKIFARESDTGLLLLEDFGDASFAKLLEKGGGDASSPIISHKRGTRDEGVAATVCDGAAQLHEKLFTLATDVLIALHQHPQAVPENLREYHPEKMLEDIELFVQWRTPNITALEKEDFRAAWRKVLPLAHRVPASLLLRDYHVANLMLLPNRTGIQQAGLLDFQDAYRGPVTYDLISLLEDARRDVPETLQKKLFARYLAAFPALDREIFETSLAILAAQRHTRVLGIFERLARHEGKLDYRRLHSPRVERRLRHALKHPILADVKTWMERHAVTN
jgi:aminoglycoside/choline kinase family phosphotransferase